jgi:hypothetical protein
MPPKTLPTVQLDPRRSGNYELAEDASLLVDLDVDIQLSTFDSIHSKERRASTKATKLVPRLGVSRH